MESIPEINLNTAKTTAKQAAASLKSAGSLVAKKAERTKLVTVTLPRAYAELGKAAYKDASRRDHFTDLFKAVDELLAQRKRIQEEAKARPTADSFIDKAKKAAADAATMARSKAIDLQAYQTFAKLGEAVYRQHGSESGPTELVEPIGKAIARRDQLDQETKGIETASKGRWITPKRILLGVAILWVIGLVGSILDPKHGGGSGGGGSGGGGAERSDASSEAAADHAQAVMRQCCIGSPPATVETLMHQGGFARSRTEDKTINGKPVLAHFYCDGDVFFMFNRNVNTGEWGLTGVGIDGTTYIPPMTIGDKPIRMSK